MIQSKANSKIKWLRRIQQDRRFRWQEGFFVVEGIRWLTELLELEQWPTLSIITEAGTQDPAIQKIAEQLPRPPLLVSEQIMGHASLMETPPGILAAAPIISLPLTPAPTLILILDRIANPGNLGALLRSAAAAGADGVLLSSGCADPFSPKALRGGMGAQLRLPIKVMEWSEISENCENLATYAAASQGTVPYYQINWCAPSALIIGGEAGGISEWAVDAARLEISIPMKGSVESLNASVAGGIILFEAARQRDISRLENKAME